MGLLPPIFRVHRSRVHVQLPSTTCRRIDVQSVSPAPGDPNVSRSVLSRSRVEVKAGAHIATHAALTDLRSGRLFPQQVSQGTMAKQRARDPLIKLMRMLFS